MNVAETIKALKEMPQDSEVVFVNVASFQHGTFRVVGEGLQQSFGFRPQRPDPIQLHTAFVTENGLLMGPDWPVVNPENTVKGLRSVVVVG